MVVSSGPKFKSMMQAYTEAWQYLSLMKEENKNMGAVCKMDTASTKGY